LYSFPDSIRHLAFTHLGLILAYISNSSFLVSLLISSFFLQPAAQRKKEWQIEFSVLDVKNKRTQEKREKEEAFILAGSIIKLFLT
jgi:hypothetical protein